ncbi:MAG: hypothetical protein MHM6MM_000867 [Cercozoa sp. M6MM]
MSDLQLNFFSSTPSEASTGAPARSKQRSRRQRIRAQSRRRGGNARKPRNVNHNDHEYRQVGRHAAGRLGQQGQHQGDGRVYRYRPTATLGVSAKSKEDSSAETDSSAPAKKKKKKKVVLSEKAKVDTDKKRSVAAPKPQAIDAVRTNAGDVVESVDAVADAAALAALPQMDRAGGVKESLQHKMSRIGASKRAFDDESDWRGMRLDERLVRQLREHMRILQPTQVQTRAVPAFLGRRDVLVRSPTGSGKTLAYLVPLVHRLARQSASLSRENAEASSGGVTRADGTLAIVLAPTRELCLQIEAQLQQLLRAFHWLVPGVVMGGEKKKSEKARLRKGVTALVATPGRLLDHMRTTQSFKYDRCGMLVLDEADRLLDLGFEKQVREIVESLRAAASRTGARGRTLQTALVSATLPLKLRKLAEFALQNPVTVHSTALADEQILARQELLEKEPFAQSEQEQNAAEDEQEQEQEEEELQKPRRRGGIDAEYFSSDEESDSEDEKDQQIPEQDEVGGVVVDSIEHSFLETPPSLRLPLLGAFLRRELLDAKSDGEACKVLVFVQTTAQAEFLSELLRLSFWPDIHDYAHLREGAQVDWSSEHATPLLDTEISKLHGNMLQKERTQVWKDFGSKAGGILVCTDVAARGLDLPAVDWIVQMDCPMDLADFVHRVGRTARMGRRGRAMLMLQPSEKAIVPLLSKKFGIRFEESQLRDVLRALVDDAMRTRLRIAKLKGMHRPPGHQLQVSAREHYCSLEQLFCVSTGPT